MIKRKNVARLLLASSVLFILGCSGGDDSSTPNISPEEETKTPSPTQETSNYSITVVDDFVSSATISVEGCSSVIQESAGKYKLINCTKKPGIITVEGGFVDLNGDGIQDSGEPDMGMPLILNTAQTVNLVVSPITTLLATSTNTNDIKTLATKLGLTEEDLFKAPRGEGDHQDVLRKINRILILAKEQGVDDVPGFIGDFRENILSDTTDDAINSFASELEKNPEKYIKKYGVVFTGFVTEGDTNTKDLLKDISEALKVADDSVVFRGFIYDQQISNADIKLYKYDTAGNKIEITSAIIEDGADNTLEKDNGSWKITMKKSILDVDQVLLLEGRTTIIDKNNISKEVVLNSALSTKVLKNTLTNSIDVSDIKDIVITNVTTAKLSLVKALNPEALKSATELVKQKQIIEQNPNLQEILKITSAAIKTVVDGTVTLEISDDVKEDTESFSNTLVDALIEDIYGTQDLTTIVIEEKRIAGVKETLIAKASEVTTASITEVSETLTIIEENKILNDQLSSTVKETSVEGDIIFTKDYLNGKILYNVWYDDEDNNSKWEIETFVFTLDTLDLYGGTFNITGLSNTSSYTADSQYLGFDLDAANEGNVLQIQSSTATTAEVCWNGTIKTSDNCVLNEEAGEYFFTDKNEAQAFYDSKLTTSQDNNTTEVTGFTSLIGQTIIYKSSTGTIGYRTFYEDGRTTGGNPYSGLYAGTYTTSGNRLTITTNTYNMTLDFTNVATINFADLGLGIPVTINGQSISVWKNNSDLPANLINSSITFVNDSGFTGTLSFSEHINGKVRGSDFVYVYDKDTKTITRVVLKNGKITTIILNDTLQNLAIEHKIRQVDGSYETVTGTTSWTINPPSVRNKAIEGIWTDTEAINTYTLVFDDKGNYTHVSYKERSPSSSDYPGLEFGTYTWDETSGKINVKTTDNRNGGYGFSTWDTTNSNTTISINNDILTGTIFDGTLFDGTFTVKKVNYTSPIHGIWKGLNDSDTVTFNVDGSYGLASEAVNDSEHTGREIGTYTWNEESKLFTSTATIDTNGGWGIGNNTQSKGITVSVNNNILSLTSPEDQQTYYFIRVLP